MIVQLSVNFAVAASLLFSVLGVLVYSLFERSISDDLDAFLDSKADIIVESITTYWQTLYTNEPGRLTAGRLGRSEDSPFFAQMAKRWAKDIEQDPLFLNAAVEILDEKGFRIAESRSMDSRIAMDPRMVRQVLERGPAKRDIHLDSGPSDQRAFRALALPVRYGKNIAYVVQVIVPLTRTESYLDRLRAILLLFIPLALASAALTGWAGASSSVVPLGRMVEQLRKIGERPFDVRLEEPHIAELAELAASFNTMLRRVEDSFESQTDFYNDISHQLKTPLTVLKGEMELALRQERDAAEYRRTLESGLEEVNRMSRLIARMLTIARFDSGQVALQIGDCDISALAAKVAAVLGTLAAAKGVEIVVSAPPGFRATVDEFRLEQALSNLVDNAIAHAPQGSRVDLEVVVDDSFFSLRVRDRGPGVPLRDRDRLFKRYQRGDLAVGPGYGIGLAIAKSIAELHGGRATYEPAEPGSIFSIVIPRMCPI
jgi:two-component system heavy metal sensor histidine kinase CusS